MVPLWWGTGESVYLHPWTSSSAAFSLCGCCQPHQYWCQGFTGSQEPCIEDFPVLWLMGGVKIEFGSFPAVIWVRDHGMNWGCAGEAGKLTWVLGKWGQWLSCLGTCLGVSGKVLCGIKCGKYVGGRTRAFEGSVREWLGYRDGLSCLRLT